MQRAVATALLVLMMCAGAVAAAPRGAVPPVLRIAVGTPLEPALAWGAANGPHGASSAEVRVAPGDPEAILVTISPDGDGTYRAGWSVLALDGHPIAGTASFVVGSAYPVAHAVTPRGADGIGPLGVLARLLVLCGVLGTMGMALTRRWVLGVAWHSGGIWAPGENDAAGVMERTARVAAGPVRVWWRTWWALAVTWGVGLVLGLIAQVSSLGISGGQVGTLLRDTRWGIAWMVLAVLLVIACVAATVARRGELAMAPSTARAVLMSAPGALAAVVLAWSGHAGTGTDATLGTALDALHGWATAAWLGGLVMLAVLAVPIIRRLDDHDAVHLGASVIVRFSAMAVAAVVVLVVTGVYRSLAELPSLSALWTTSYGVVLLVKLGVFAGMLALAAWNRFSLHPRMERAALGLGGDATGAMSALRVSVRAEIVLAVAVLVTVAVLVSIPPPV